MPQTDEQRRRVLGAYGITESHIQALAAQFHEMRLPKAFIYHAKANEDVALAFLLQAALETVHIPAVIRRDVVVDEAGSWVRDTTNEAEVYFLLCSGNLFEEDTELCTFSEIAFRNLRAHNEKRIFPLALDHSVKVDKDSPLPQADHEVVGKLANVSKSDFTKWKVRNEFLTGLFQIFRAFSTDAQKAYRPKLPKEE